MWLGKSVKEYWPLSWLVNSTWSNYKEGPPIQKEHHDLELVHVSWAHPIIYSRPWLLCVFSNWQEYIMFFPQNSRVQASHYEDKTLKSSLNSKMEFVCYLSPSHIDQQLHNLFIVIPSPNRLDFHSSKGLLLLACAHWLLNSSKHGMEISL